MTPKPVATYDTHCPNCGSPLRPFVGPVDQAPWVCLSQFGGCDRAWWVRELAADAQLLWDGNHEAHHGDGLAVAALRGEVHAEVRAAGDRGVSVRPDMLALMSVTDLRGLLTGPWRARMDPALSAAVVAAVTAKGV